MDPSTSPVQDVQSQQSVARAQQPPVTVTQSSHPDENASGVQKPQEHKTQISVGGVEAGAAIVQEDADADDEEELMVAPQETKNVAVLGQNEEGDESETTTVVVAQPSIADVQENIELRPS